MGGRLQVQTPFPLLKDPSVQLPHDQQRQVMPKGARPRGTASPGHICLSFLICHMLCLGLSGFRSYVRKTKRKNCIFFPEKSNGCKGRVFTPNGPGDPFYVPFRKTVTLALKWTPLCGAKPPQGCLQITEPAGNWSAPAPSGVPRGGRYLMPTLGTLVFGEEIPAIRSKALTPIATFPVPVLHHLNI